MIKQIIDLKNWQLIDLDISFDGNFVGFLLIKYLNGQIQRQINLYSLGIFYGDKLFEEKYLYCKQEVLEDFLFIRFKIDTTDNSILLTLFSENGLLSTYKIEEGKNSNTYTLVYLQEFYNL